jgi:glycosyltransferase involved in cell wall biosynthesis
MCNGFSTRNLWATDIALFGQDITSTREYKEADVIHLHWVNQGFISLATIRKMLDDGKKVVWTMHDAWNAMGAYHLKIQRKDDYLERSTFERKQRLYADRKIQFVTCSQWLMNEALTSPLMAEQRVVAIPNPLDTGVFKPVPHQNRRRVLFVAQFVNNPMKGMKYLEEASAIINEKVTKFGHADSNRVEIIALGRDIPYISDTHEMARLYASVDAFVLPSLSENLPNTIMEAMACGTPCVGFRVGGIPEMIDHLENGYLANYKDSEDLAKGILYVLDEANHERLATNARQKIINCYGEKAVASRYIEIYGNEQ